MDTPVLSASTQDDSGVIRRTLYIDGLQRTFGVVPFFISPQRPLLTKSAQYLRIMTLHVERVSGGQRTPVLGCHCSNERSGSTSSGVTVCLVKLDMAWRYCWINNTRINRPMWSVALASLYLRITFINLSKFRCDAHS
jgi:hypothetical protein